MGNLVCPCDPYRRHPCLLPSVVSGQGRAARVLLTWFRDSTVRNTLTIEIPGSKNLGHPPGQALACPCHPARTP